MNTPSSFVLPETHGMHVRLGNDEELEYEKGRIKSFQITSHGTVTLYGYDRSVAYFAHILSLETFDWDEAGKLGVTDDKSENDE